MQTGESLFQICKGGVEMSSELFLVMLAALFAALFAWAFRALPREHWQILAAVPQRKNETGEWQGLNLTFYGFFQATSNALGVAILFVLLGMVAVPPVAILSLILFVFLLCWPAARLVARVVEKKAHTFTIGGALFVGVLAMPWIILLLNKSLHSGNQVPVLPALAAAAIAYAYGEGLGRLACISFGCCYGKRVTELSPRLRRWFDPLSFTFAGETKKAAYAGGLEGVRVVPVQAITSVVFITIALVGTYLFLSSRFNAALLLTMAATQLWRFLSEKLRADARGKAETVSAYQVMALLMVLYAAAMAYAFSGTSFPSTVITDGLRALWNPAVMLFCQGIWLAVFLITGRSSVTGSTVSFFVRQDRI
jgi:hypothetical protein